MKNSKHIFSKGLFLEGIERLKLPGLIFGLIITAITVFSLVPQLFNTNGNGIGYFSAFIIREEPILGTHLIPQLATVFFIAAPVLTFKQFRFLRRRNESDFFHSLPNSRVCVFVSFIAAVFAWLLMLCVTMTAVGLLICLCSGGQYVPDISSVLTYALGCFVTSAAVSGGIAIALSLTGTLFTGMTMSLAVLYLPRMLIIYFAQTLLIINPMLLNDSLSPFFSAKINGVTGPVFDLLLDSRTASTYCNNEWMGSQTHFAPIAYTAALTVLYCVIGCVVFSLRRSEFANAPAGSRFRQSAMRIIIPLIFAIPATSMLFYDYTSGYSPQNSVLIIDILITILIYYIYELITTHRLRRPLRLLGGLVITFLCCGIFLGSAWAAKSITLTFSPDASQIKSVEILSDEVSNDQMYLDYNLDQILSDDYSNNELYRELVPDEVPVQDNIPKTYDYYHNHQNFNVYNYWNYAYARAYDAKLTDPEALQIVSDALKENNRELASGLENYRRSHFNYSSDGTTELYYTQTTVRINTAFGSRIRRIYIPGTKSKKLYDARLNDPELQKAWLTLPNSKTADSIMCSAVDSGYNVLSDENSRKIAASLQEEMSEFDFDTWYNYITDGGENNYTELVVRYYYDSQLLVFKVPNGFFPKTMNLYRQLLFEDTQNPLDLLDKLRQKHNVFNQAIVSCYIYNEEKGYYEEYGTNTFIDLYDNEETEKSSGNVQSSSQARELIADIYSCRVSSPPAQDSRPILFVFNFVENKYDTAGSDSAYQIPPFFPDRSGVVVQVDSDKIDKNILSRISDPMPVI